MKHYFVINTILFIILILLVLSCVYCVIRKKNIEPFKYHKCNKYQVGTILNNVLTKNNITKTNDQDWDIYLPCGYNYVERELTEIKPKSNNQIIFGISGCDSIVSKNSLWKLIKDYYGRDRAKLIMPETWVLKDNREMKLFMRDYDKRQMYILKKNVQRKEGLKLTKNLEEILNASKENYKVVQKYHNNLFLINNRKVNLRIYLLIVCQKGHVKAYLHEYGKCIYTNKEYNDNLFDFESNITSYHLDMNVYKKNPFSLEELKEYLKQNGKNYEKLFTSINNIIYLTMMSVEDKLCNLQNIYNNKTFQLFGLDIIFDKNMNPYLLEMNKGPDMIPRSITDEKMKFKVEQDIFNILEVADYNNYKEKNGFYKIYEAK